MIDKFMLNKAREIFEMVSNSYFKRYDLTNEWSQLSRQINISFNEIGREPFIYELIDKILNNLEDSIRNQVKNILYEKNNEWFLNIGQYFFYNYSQWINHFSSKDNHSLNEFIYLWWTKFLDLENIGTKYKKGISLPKKILLELTNNCNLNCVMCGIGKNGYDPSRDFSLNLIHTLSKTVLPHAEIIRLNGLGESTIIPNFLEYLAVLGELHAQLEIVTNLTVVNQKIWDNLLENNTNFLISCDSSSSQLFESIRRGAKFTNFKKNLQYISKNISNPLQAQIIFTLMEYNIHEISNIVKFAAEMGLGGVIINVVKEDSIHNEWMYQQFENIKKQFQEAYNLASSYNIALKLPDHIGKLPIDKKISNPSCHLSCNNPWEEVYIRYNGDLTVCNMLNPYIYGNCQNKAFEEIWKELNAELFRTFVNTEYRNYYCRDCYYLI